MLEVGESRLGWISESEGDQMKRKLTVKPRSGRMRKAEIYAISYTETYERGYFVRATSFDEACEKLEDAIMNGQVDGPEYCIDSSYLNTTGDFTQRELEVVKVDVK